MIRHRISIQYALGQRVRVAGQPGVSTIERWRYECRRHLPPVIEYGVVPTEGDFVALVTWVNEADVRPWVPEGG